MSASQIPMSERAHFEQWVRLGIDKKWLNRNALERANQGSPLRLRPENIPKV